MKIQLTLRKLILMMNAHSSIIFYVILDACAMRYYSHTTCVRLAIL